MKTFSDLLQEYTERTGVSDAELARAVGVQRQTIFRWKEGLVVRPRSAEDVMRLATKLRLSAGERDELLLAAGFPPVAAPAAPTAELQPQEGDAELLSSARTPGSIAALPETPATAPVRRGQRRAAAVAIIALAVLFLLAGASHALLRQARYPQAAEGERLIVVAQFGNYTGGAQGYNVAGRLSEALERELAATALEDARVAVWPSAVMDEPSAGRALERSGAALLIWGEYDSGRVVARFLPAEQLLTAARELSLQASTAADLPAVINSTLPSDIRYLALYTLAQAYLQGSDTGAARAALARAALHLPADQRTQAAHHFLWAYANQTLQPPDLDAAIEGYSQALQFDSGLEAANNNRAVAYLRRRAPGDAAAAVDDLTHYLAEHADDAVSYNNRGSAYFSLGGPDNAQRALADFDRAITLAPGDPTGYFNRGLVYVRLDDARWRADFERAREAGHPRAQEGLCWGYSLSEEPAAAIAHCQEALEAGEPGALENLGIAYARGGHYREAAVALRRFRDALAKTPDGVSPAKEAQLRGGSQRSTRGAIRLIRKH